MLPENTLMWLSLLLVKPLLIIVVILLGLTLLHKKSAALQHFWLTLGMSALLILPLLFMLLPEIEWQVLPALDHPSPAPSAWLADLYRLLLQLSEPRWLMSAAAVYFFGVFWLLFYIGLGLIAVALQTREAEECRDAGLLQLLAELRGELGIARDLRLTLSNEVQSPQMWGVIAPVIMLPGDAVRWPDERKLSVLLHELGHVSRCDWATTLAVRSCCAMFWFLPPVWWLAARLFHCAEIACDDFIYRLHNHYRLRNTAVSYAENLLVMAQAAKGKPLPPAEAVLSMTGHSPIFLRIEAILDRQRPRQNATPEARQYWVLVLLVMLLPVASLQLMPIRNMLKAQVLNSQVPQPEEIKNSGELAAEALTQVQRLDAQTLRKLKQQLLHSESPRFAVEKMTVTGTRDFADTDRDLGARSAASPEFGNPQPLIRIQGYMPLESVVPQYPRAALHRGIEGEVTVEFSIAQDGSIIDPRILYSHPRRVFDKAVLAALQRSRYKPQIIDGNPVILQGVSETFTFQIDHSPSASPRRR